MEVLLPEWVWMCLRKPLRPLQDGLDAIKVQYERERGRHAGRAQYNQAAVARCELVLQQTTLLLMGETATASGW